MVEFFKVLEIREKVDKVPFWEAVGEVGSMFSWDLSSDIVWNWFNGFNAISSQVHWRFILGIAEHLGFFWSDWFMMAFSYSWSVW